MVARSTRAPNDSLRVLDRLTSMKFDKNLMKILQ